MVRLCYIGSSVLYYSGSIYVEVLVSKNDVLSWIDCRCYDDEDVFVEVVVMVSMAAL